MNKSAEVNQIQLTSEPEYKPKNHEWDYMIVLTVGHNQIKTEVDWDYRH